MLELSPQDAYAKIKAGALLIDIREVGEVAREQIIGARNEPLSRLGESIVTRSQQEVIFTCMSGMRTRANQEKLASLSQNKSFILAGGLQAWKVAGLPTHLNKKAPIEIMRQMQITAGSLVLLGVMLAHFVSPNFILLPLFIGAGLVFSGVSGWCGMANLLKFMPWNRA